MFVSAATGLAVGFAVIRGIRGRPLGNFHHDLVRSLTRALIPLSLVLALYLQVSGDPLTPGAQGYLHKGRAFEQEEVTIKSLGAGATRRDPWPRPSRRPVPGRRRAVQTPGPPSPCWTPLRPGNGRCWPSWPPCSGSAASQKVPIPRSGSGQGRGDP
jgi:hypothetical protein